MSKKLVLAILFIFLSIRIAFGIDTLLTAKVDPAISSVPDVEVELTVREASSGSGTGNIILEGKICNAGGSEFRPRPEDGLLIRLEARDSIDPEGKEEILIDRNDIAANASGKCVNISSVYEIKSKDDACKEVLEKYFVLSVIPDDACKHGYEKVVDLNSGNNQAVASIKYKRDCDIK